MPHRFRRPFALGLLIAIACAAATPALASSGGSLPWEGPLQTIQESITHFLILSELIQDSVLSL